MIQAVRMIARVRLPWRTRAISAGQGQWNGRSAGGLGLVSVQFDARAAT